jgi:hypothetical protein
MARTVAEPARKEATLILLDYYAVSSTMKLVVSVDELHYEPGNTGQEAKLHDV